MEHLSQEGSIFLENGVHRSYSSNPRLNELKVIADMFQKNVRIQLIFDPNTNYFCSAIIEKAPFQTDNFFEQHITPGMKLIPLQEVVDNTFFQCEIYLRELIMVSFRDFKVFYHFNHHIIAALKNIVS